VTIRLTLVVCIYLFLKVIDLDKIADKSQLLATFIVISSVFLVLFLIFKIFQEMVSIKEEIHDSVKRKKD
jgi:fumarate reductase subunit D|tara:strand:+ start:43 stop:252 length:210 start_codon:yes stop_codon:yes gene_type:complete